MDEVPLTRLEVLDLVLDLWDIVEVLESRGEQESADNARTWAVWLLLRRDGAGGGA
jgi:hypothetical protein